MLRHRPSHTDHDLPDDVVEEERIRADERAHVEDKLRAWEADRHVDEHDAAVGEGRHILDERSDRDDHVVIAKDDPIEVVRRRSFSFGQLLTMLTGAALIALGIAALVETGVETPLNQPVESVLGWDHTPLLGIVEIAAGAALLLLSLRPGGRWLAAIVGVALILAGLAIVGELQWTTDELGAEQEFAWVPLVAGLLAVLAALLTPRRHQRMTGLPNIR